MIIDIKTLLLLHFIFNVINAGAITIIWYQYRKRFAGISLWLGNMILQAAGIGLILLRGLLPDFVSIVVANTFLLAGVICLIIGLEQFIEQKSSQIRNFILIIVYVWLLYYFFAIHPDLVAREILVSITGILMYTQLAWLLLHTTPSALRPITRIAGIIMAGYILVSIIRIMLTIAFPIKTNDLFQSGFVDSMTITLYLALNSCLTIALILMVNRRLLNEVQIQEEKFTKAFHSSPYAILITRPSDGKIFEINDGFVKITGYDYAEVLGKTTLDLNLWVKKEDRDVVIKNLVMNKKIQGLEHQFRKKSGDLMTGLYSADTIVIDNEKFILSSISDITELSQIKQQLQREATHDNLTGLPNRKLFYDRFYIAQAYAQRYHKHLAVMSLDLDMFKTVNDTLGHDIGDKVLIEVARRLIESLRKVDTVARFGGDEFLLLLSEIKHKEDVNEVAQKIIKSIHLPFIIDEHEIRLTASIGISLYPEDGIDMNDLIKNSDKSLYQVKRNGKNDFCFYDSLKEQ